jgi:hypothetical protein
LTGSESREAIGYDHGYDADVFYLGLALDPAYVEGFVGAAWRGSARTTPRGGGDKEKALEIHKVDCEVRVWCPEGL